MMKNTAPTQLALAIVAMGIIGIALPAASVMATTQTLRQTIHGDDRCAHTTIATAEGNVNAADCEVFAPSIASAVIDDKGVLMVRGVYDAVHSGQSLTVRFHGRDYRLGDAEITTKGNLWVLILDTTTLSPALEIGKEYTGEVVMTAHGPHGAPTQQKATFTVTSMTHTSPQPPAPGTTPTPATPQSLPQRIMTALANTGQPIGLIIAAAGGLIVAAGWLLIWRRKRRKKEGG